MFISRSQVGCLLLTFLIISALNREVLGARHPKEKAENLEKTQVSKQGSNTEDDQDFFAAINREVPSSPDPLHNR
ncbi:hypothetical protein I3843_08G160100 [Carya illinoinensis]|nr:hypothetical protein I3843_08G160100 [Carya illinoinensis]